MLKEFFELIKQTFTAWREDKAPRLAAAIAYYTAFSIAPLLILVISVVGFIVSEQTVQEQILSQVQNEMGAGVADLVTDLIQNVSKPGAGTLSAVIGTVALLFGATGIFVQLQNALNTVWKAEESDGQFIRSRALSFVMLLLVGLLLLASLVISAVIAALDQLVVEPLPGSQLILNLINLVVSLGLTTLLFALIYKYLPDVEIAWKDVWVGAAITAVLFTIGKTLLGFYLGYSGTTSMYGAAGSLVALLLWIYYSAQIVLFGAEFTQVYARRYGSRIRPVGVAIEQAEAAQAPSRPDRSPRRALESPTGSAAWGLAAFIVIVFMGHLQNRKP